MFKTLKWEDWAGAVIGVWLLASPWVLGYSGHFAATANAVLLGIVLASAEMMHLRRHKDAEEWFDLIVGLWLVASPAILGFGSIVSALANTVVVGLLTILFAAWALSPMDRMIGAGWGSRATRH
jgi:hypothetical protein